ncbi:MAG: 50S ribosomal protein L18 [bacterium]|jgi:large subunit ribosomal protein L18|nr:50S ribosomal protein L18 [bacterium]MBK7187845.1 50S ribosomal protein L18 [bacterium]MBK7672303.1 50S ribosomal protein L18 [bacterium]
MSSTSKKRRDIRAKRKISIRKKLSGSAERPRVSILRSHKNIYAQVIDDTVGHTLVACDGKKAAVATVPEDVKGNKCAIAYSVGRALAEMAKAKGIDRVVFDRSGYLYHGRVAALARGLRDGGLEV